MDGTSVSWWNRAPDTMPGTNRLSLLHLASIMFVYVFKVSSAAGLSSGESLTAVFSSRAQECYSSRGHGLDGANCGETFTLGASYAIRLLSDPPTKTTEDSIRNACEGGCMHAVLSEVSASFRDDTLCAQSTHGMFGGPVMVALGDAACAVLDGDGSDEELCFVGVTNVLRNRGMLQNLVAMDGSFAWPERYEMMAVCAALQRVGCCAPTFQLAATAFFMSECQYSTAMEVSMLTQRCLDARTPISTEICNMAGVNRTSWLKEFDPQENSTMLADTEQRCSTLSEDAFTQAVNADSGEGCWPDVCVLVEELIVAAKNLGIRNAEAMTYVIMLASSLAVLCACVCTTCVMSWVMHRLDAKGRKLYMPGPDDGAQNPLDEHSDEGAKFLPPGVHRFRSNSTD